MYKIAILLMLLQFNIPLALANKSSVLLGATSRSVVVIDDKNYKVECFCEEDFAQIAQVHQSDKANEELVANIVNPENPLSDALNTTPGKAKE